MKYIVTSDIHFGHDRTPTSHIIKSFTDCILTDANKDADVLFINGDLFDKLLYLRSTEAQLVMQFFHTLLDYCHENEIVLRVLEGTTSHDYFQSAALENTNKVRPKKVNFKYIRTLDIEYIPEINKHVLYIPDEWVFDQQSLEKQVQEKLSLYNLRTVDVAMLHGSFCYQTKGMNTKSFSFDETYFLQLVTGFIHIGHHHNYTQFDRIIANGSLERLAHGEEEDKGYVVVNNDTYVFIPNPYSYTYKTIHITAKTTIESLDKQIKKLRPGSHVRLKMKSDHEFNSVYKELKLRYIDYHLKRQTTDDTSDDYSATYIIDDNQMEMTPNFLIDTKVDQVLREAVLAKHSLTESEVVKMEHYLQVFKRVNSSETLTE